MAWSSPKTWVTGYKVLASDLNSFLSDNDTALRTGGIAIASQAAGDVVYASSSTQLARLAADSGKFLKSGASSVSWESISTAVSMYGVTLLDADNTTSEITVATATITSAIADGDSLVLDVSATWKNNSGSSESFKFDIRYGGVEGDLCTINGANNSTEGYQNMRIVLVRSGSDAIASVGGIEASSSSAHTRQVNAVRLTSPTFDAGETLSLKCTLETADSDMYFRPEASRLAHFVL